MSRERFTALFSQLKELRERRSQIVPEYDAALAERFREYKEPWRKIDSDIDVRVKAASLDEWELDCIRRPLFEATLEELRLLRQETNAVDFEMSRIAEKLLPDPGENWMRLTAVHGSSYSTQGYGANTYAKRNAEMRAHEALRLGVEAEVRTVQTDRPKNPGRWYIHTNIFEVWVRVDTEVDLELVRRGQPMTTRDFLKLCWSKGVNPRVYNPFLPHGLEARLGIDFQGRDVGA